MMMSRWCLLSMWLLLPALVSAPAAAEDFDATRWKLEEGTSTPSYAATEPVSSDLNIDAVVLGCEPVGRHQVLQLQIYTKDGGPLRLLHAGAAALGDAPKTELAIDNAVFPVSLLFADNYAVVADGEEDRYPVLSDRLMAAMQSGKTMTLRFGAGSAAPAGAAVIDLRSTGAQAAIGAMRHCSANRPGLPVGITALTQ
jgi:hypothetical protein